VDEGPVAACGTSVTAEHLAQLRQATPGGLADLIVALDPDPAGQKAAVRVWSMLDPAEAAGARTVSLPDGVDPAQLVQDGLVDELRRAVDEPRPLTHAVIDTIVNDARLDHIEGRVAAVRQVAATVAQLPTAAVAEATTYLTGRMGDRLDARTVADEIVGGAAQLVVSHVPAGWKVTVGDDLKLAVTAPADSAGSNGQFEYRGRDMAGRWSPREMSSVDVELRVVYPVSPNWFTWAGTPITLDPAAANNDSLKSVGATDLAIQVPAVQLPGTAATNPDGTFTFAPAAGFTGDVELSFRSGDARGTTVGGVLHVLGPIAQDWKVTFPAGGEGQVFDLLDETLWGNHTDLTSYLDRWVATPTGAAAPRSRYAVGTIGPPVEYRQTISGLNSS